MHWVNSQKVRCYYQNEQEINALKSFVANAKSGDPRVAMFENVKGVFCADPQNIEKVVDGQKCKQWGDAEKLTREYCSSNDWEKMKSGDNTCSRTGMPNEDLFETLASEFCSANAGESWCKCYNQVQDVCGENPEGAGCAEVDAEIDEIIADLPSDGSGTIAKNEVKSRRHCWAKVCSNDRDAFVPREKKDCDLDVCIQSLNVGGGLAGSDVQMNCDLNEPPPANDDYEKDSKDKETGLVKSLGGSKVVYLGGAGAGVASSMSSCFMIILLLLMST